MIKYVARLNGTIVGKRTSKDRIYTHAIVVDQSLHGWRKDRGMHVAAWAGRSDLAAKEASKWSKCFAFVTIVQAETVTKPSNARLAAAFNDAVAGTALGKAFKFVGKD